jgi:hypothetical protein
LPIPTVPAGFDGSPGVGHLSKRTGTLLLARSVLTSHLWMTTPGRPSRSGRLREITKITRLPTGGRSLGTDKTLCGGKALTAASQRTRSSPVGTGGAEAQGGSCCPEEPTPVAADPEAAGPRGKHGSEEGDDSAQGSLSSLLEAEAELEAGTDSWPAGAGVSGVSALLPPAEQGVDRNP